MTDLSKKDIDRWAKKQQAGSVGRSFEIAKEDERHQFVDWFYGVLNEMLRTKEPME